MTSSTDVAVVIPTLNGGRDLERLLDALAMQQGPYRPRVVAIDSGSTDDTLTLLRDCGARTLSVPAAEFNHGATRNLALETVDTDFAVIMVQDAVPDSHQWLSSMVAPMQSDDTIAGTWARQRPRDDASRVTAYYQSRWLGAAETDRTVGPITHAQFSAMSPMQRLDVCTFDNVCACIRMNVWRRFPFSRVRIAEDVEWALRVLQSGHRLAYVAEAVVVHSHDRPSRYELQRAYVTHQQLQVLFGLATVPGIPNLLRAIFSTMPLHLKLAMGERSGRMRAIARAAGLAVAMPLGQYLGARSAREGRELLAVASV